MGDVDTGNVGVGSGRRYALVVGVSNYASDLPDLPGAVEDAQRLADRLASMGYERVLAEISADPTSAVLRRGISEWAGEAMLGPDDVVVAYFSGHGVLREGRHYLLGSDDEPDRRHSGLAGADLVGLVADSLAGHSLTLIDTCHAGAVVNDVAQWSAELGRAGRQGTASWVLTSARGAKPAYGGVLVDALEDVFARPSAGPRQRFLDVREVTERVNRYFAEHEVPQRAGLVGPGAGGADPFFPNPAFVPGLPRDALDVASVVRIRQAQQDHFEPRSRGVAHAAEPGDFFFGRTEALTRVAQWLRSPHSGRRALVVTGSPGSGKSAVLGRVLALTDPDSPARLSTAPEALPPPDLTVIPLQGRGSTAETVTADLSAVLDLPTTDREGVLRALGARTDPVVVLLDALDEFEPDEYRRVVADLVRPLTSLPAVRLIIGTRRAQLAELGAPVDVIDLDAPEFRDEEGLRAYAYHLLVDDRTRQSAGRRRVYREAPARAATAAEAIAREAGPSFLAAQLAAHALVHAAGPADSGPPELSPAQHLPDPFRDAPGWFESCLDRFGPDRSRVVRLLLPLSYAQGPGLPMTLWPAMAEALTHERYTDDDLRRFLARGSALVTETALPTGTVYRLFHQLLAEHLQGSGQDQVRHRRMVRALTERVPVLASGERDWASADPYIHEHLATHAAAGHVLGDLLQDAGYLRHAAPEPLLRALADSAAIGPARPPGDRSPSAPSGPDARTEAADQAASHLLSAQPNVLVVATEWFSAHGGLSTLNRHLCVALAAAGARVFCVVLGAEDSEVADAATKGVALLCHPGAPGAPEYGRLTRRPALPPGVEPDLIIGHARITGPAAAHLHEDFFPGARRLHFVHMAPDEIEWHKLDDTTDKADRAEERTEIERRLGASAHRVVAVGPRLHARFRNELCDTEAPEPLRLDPGFDLPGSTLPTVRTPPPGSPHKVLLLGRTDDARLKGVDLAARACGLVHDLRTKASAEPIELVVRGAPRTTADVQQDTIRTWSGNPGLPVVVRAYSSEPGRLEADMMRASVVVMPSRSEGFGLVGREAIIRGVPILVSANSGLAQLLREHLGDDADHLIVPMTGKDDEDAAVWAARIEKCLVDREAAFTRIAAARGRLAARVTWAGAAALVLGEAPPRA
ncbi:MULTISPECIES: caspase family protein [unclassified Streptomyces]|uniref:caspase family protein n=1 Tax=unclassified Streptomyces TaxID=2593676 RepID=UPI0013A6A04C|nr:MULTISPECIES: caspase family protein [unclassified Streptomyces]